MENFGNAWTLVSRDLGQWIVVTLVAAFATFITCGLGALLVGPNYFVVAKRSIQRGVPPEVGDLFNTEVIGEYVVYLIVMIVASFVASVVPVVGSLVLTTLTFWALMLIIDRRFGAIDALQASFHHAKNSFFDVLVFAVILYVIYVLGACACGIGMLISLPVTTVACWLYYEAEKEKILAAAIAAGLKPIG